MNTTNFYRSAIVVILFAGTITYAEVLQEVDSKTFGGGSVLAIDVTKENDIHYIAYSGSDNKEKKEIRIGRFDTDSETLVLRKTEHFSKANSCKVNSVSWLNAQSTDKKMYLAAGGYTENTGKEIAIYEYQTNKNKLKRKCTTNFDNGEVFAVSWFSKDNVGYLVAGGNDSNMGQNIRIYKFENNSKLTLLDSENFYHGTVYSIDCLVIGDRCLIAIGGNEVASIQNEIKIYEFDTSSNTLSLIATDSFEGNTARTVKWHQNSETIYLAIGGHDAMAQKEVRLFTFDTSTDTLTLVETKSFCNGIVYALSWKDDGSIVYLVAGGDDSIDTKEIRVYSLDTSTDMLTTKATTHFSSGMVYALCSELIGSVLYLFAGGDDMSDMARPLRVYKLIEA